MSPIFNASQIPLNTQMGSIPDLSGTLKDWFQSIVFTEIAKSVSAFELVETPTSTTFLGVIQPFTDQQLMLKPEGERKWVWKSVHAEPVLDLSPDDQFTYLGIRYRVMEKLDYAVYGFVEYHIIQDYTGASS